MQVTGMRKINLRLNMIEYPESLLEKRRQFKKERNSIANDHSIDDQTRREKIKQINDREHEFGKKHMDVVLQKIKITNDFGHEINNQFAAGKIDFSNISGWFNQDLFYIINEKTREYEPNDIGKSVRISYSRGGGSAFREFFYSEENKLRIIEEFKKNGYRVFDLDNPPTLKTIIQQYIKEKNNNLNSPLVTYIDTHIPELKTSHIQEPVVTQTPISSFSDIDTVIKEKPIYNLPTKIIDTIQKEVDMLNKTQNYSILDLETMLCRTLTELSHYVGVSQLTPQENVIELYEKETSKKITQVPLDEKPLCKYLESCFKSKTGNEIPYMTYKDVVEKETWYKHFAPTIQNGVELGRESATIRYLGQIKKHHIDELKKYPTSSIEGFNNLLKALFVAESDIITQKDLSFTIENIDDRIDLMRFTGEGKSTVTYADLKKYSLSSSPLYESVQFFKNGNIEIVFKNKNIALDFFSKYISH